ncbi:hypothetical protein CMUS01_15939 [Colletotrichum musicola]|uniref:Uncharacterized protein n=1 Tax=Colletotrichum musicola TaxID=2175873 RepID=A0A8H6IT96_9PEZI|nr:hypothetical protein CMUS01_15939 [Colletotrichum musicola]
MPYSRFEYPVTRPYPFKWFTPVAISGCIILTVVFSFVNLTSNGFDLKSVYTIDVNRTEATENARWFTKPLFNWRGDMRTECEPHLLTVGDSFFTSNHGFRYIVKGIRLHVPGADGEAPDVRSSIGYKNTTLEGCFLKKMFVKSVKSDLSKSPTRWMSFKHTVAAATLQCSVLADVGVAEVTLQADYEGETEIEFDYVMDSNYKTRASIWWGTRLSNAYFIAILAAASQIPSIDVDRFPPCNYINAVRISISTNCRKQNFWGSPTLTEALHYSKIMHSMFALDLGNCESPNLLLDEGGLRYAMLDPKNANRFPGGLMNNFTLPTDRDNHRFTRLPRPDETPGMHSTVLLDESYDTIQPLMGPLSCDKATIAAQYLCSVPKQKSVGMMLLAVILAGLVFLQAAWKLLQWIATYVVAKTPRANTCQGCLQAQGHGFEEVGLEGISDKRKQAEPRRVFGDHYVRLHSQE